MSTTLTPAQWQENLFFTFQSGAVIIQIEMSYHWDISQSSLGGGKKNKEPNNLCEWLEVGEGGNTAEPSCHT